MPTFPSETAAGSRKPGRVRSAPGRNAPQAQKRHEMVCRQKSQLWVRNKRYHTYPIANMIVTIDTNIMYQALMSSLGASFRILQLVRAGNCRLALSQPVFSEYEKVLTRPKLPPDGVCNPRPERLYLHSSYEKTFRSRLQTCSGGETFFHNPGLKYKRSGRVTKPVRRKDYESLIWVEK